VIYVNQTSNVCTPLFRSLSPTNTGGTRSGQNAERYGTPGRAHNAGYERVGTGRGSNILSAGSVGCSAIGSSQWRLKPILPAGYRAGGCSPKVPCYRKRT
jgi:hypothetical protein